MGPCTLLAEGVQAACPSLPPAALSDLLYLDPSLQPSGDATLERFKEKVGQVRGHGRPTG